MKRTLASLVVLLVTTALVVASPARSDKYEDPRYGFEIKVPDGWTPVPVPPTEVWIVAKYLSDKDQFYTKRTGDQAASLSFRPEMRIIVILDPDVYDQQAREAAAQKKKEKEKRRGEEGDDDDDEEDSKYVPPFKDYQEYLRKTYSGGGFYVDSEEADEIRGVPVTKLEIKVENTGAYSGPKHLTAYVFETELGLIAVQYEIYESYFDKMSSEIHGNLKSFKPIERTEQLDFSAFTGSGSSLLSSVDELEIVDRNKRYKELERQTREKAIAGLTEGWETYEVDGVTVLTRADKKFTESVVDRILAVRAWLESTFPDVGPGRYARMPLLRICRDLDEEISFRRGTEGTDWGGMGTEIVTHKSTAGATSSEWNYVNRRTMDIWFQDRDRALYWSLPPWLTTGLRYLLAGADQKGSKLRFKPSDNERSWLREAIRDGQIVPCRELMSMTVEDFSKHNQNRNPGPTMQSGALTRYLLAGPGAKSKNTRTLVPDFLTSLHEAMQDDELAFDFKKPETEEEEDNYFEKMRDSFLDRQNKLNQAAMEKVFAAWDEGAWEDLDKNLQKYMD